MSKKPTYHELEQRVKELEEESNNLKLIKEELHDKDKHLQSILESADGFAIYRLVVNKNDPHLLRTTFVSPSIRNVLGTEPEDFSSTTFFANIHPDDSARVELANKQAFETNRFDVICRYNSVIKKQWIWIHAISTGVVNDKGHITHVNGIFIDITKQKHIEESLQKSEKHLRSLMESATNFAVYRLVIDKTNPHQLKVKFVSPSIKDILGIPEPMKFETWFKSMHSEDVDRIAEANLQAFKTLKFNEEYRTYHQNKNEWRWIHAISTGVVDKKGATESVNGILLDITEGKRAEEALNTSEARLRDISGSMDEWIWEVDAQGICTFVSEKVRSILGYSAEEILGKTPFDFMPTEEAQRVAGIFSEIIKKKSRIHDLENWNLTKDGRLICMLTNGISLLDEDGELIGYRGVNRDITDRKQAEEEVKQRTKELKRLNDHLVLAEDNERKNLASELHDSVAQSLSMAVSQIKNIKGADSGYGIETLSNVQKYIENAIKEVRILIHQLHPQILKDFSIDMVLGYLIETVNEKKQLSINYINRLAEPITLIETTKLTIYRAINELIYNILKHSGSSFAEIELSKINNSIQIRVEDKGKGFAFNTYHQKNYCGFGLYSLSERIKNMGGKLIINSSLGKGTKVILIVPVNVK